MSDIKQLTTNDFLNKIRELLESPNEWIIYSDPVRYVFKIMEITDDNVVTYESPNLLLVPKFEYDILFVMIRQITVAVGAVF